MKLFIKNMVCNRCKMVVRSELEKLGLNAVSVELGEVEIEGELSKEQKSILSSRLEAIGFAMLDDKKSQIVEKVKTLIVELIHSRNNNLRINLSDYLADHLMQDYGSLSSLFSETESTTIEKYFINQKIERVKELLAYDELTLSEIAHQLHYSSVAHLSNQFKKVTGISPTNFKNSDRNGRIELDGLLTPLL